MEMTKNKITVALDSAADFEQNYSEINAPTFTLRPYIRLFDVENY
jgi:hypothetical protein